MYKKFDHIFTNGHKVKKNKMFQQNITKNVFAKVKVHDDKMCVLPKRKKTEINN